METARLLTIGKIAYVMNQNDRLVSNDNFFWTLNRRVNKKNVRPEPASCQVSIVFIAFMLYFYFKKREKLVCL